MSVNANIPKILCAAAALAAASGAAAFDPTGEVSFWTAGVLPSSAASASSAAFDADHVVGPNVNVTRTEEATWAGNVGDRNYELKVEKGRINGAGFTLAVERKDGRTEIEGLLGTIRLRVTMDGKTVTGRYGACSFDLRRTEPGTYAGGVGCVPASRRQSPDTATATLRLTGEAAGDDPPQPQLALALAAALPR